MNSIIQDNLKKHILDNGLYSHNENLRIYEKWFSKSPRYIFKAIDKKIGISGKQICDVGCNYGSNLIHAGKDSYGIELEPYPAGFAESIGLKIYRRNIFDDISDLPKVEVIWSSAVLEHIESPHEFLRRMYFLLKPKGIIVIYVPTIPIMPSLKRINFCKKYFTGHLHGDHINAFVPSTLKFCIEKAGFKTLYLSPFAPNPLGILINLPFLNRFIDGCVYVGEKIDNWEYPQNSCRRSFNDCKGYKYISHYPNEK